ncbi:hypothetical protein PLICRDRAFT_119410 [Plicaturopsis crispa FD-325 SS-3]|uniref:Uncharacterized protein n=1 Tax=Plicaturopsis crispa FD-325 SS-3 TaxID=944288 RepID=A0A0C9T5T2_PLICR|nr:hypothetical protein PLICRDRAFT_119410 [Plicaturopsis crispa FD-325 SS-3]
MQEDIEPILSPRHRRLDLFPIQYTNMWTIYKGAQRSFWVAAPATFRRLDVLEWQESLTNVDRRYYSRLLCILAVWDGLSGTLNAVARFASEIQVPEAQFFYTFQMAVSDVHTESYFQMLCDVIPDPQERSMLKESVLPLPSVQLKAAWCKRWIFDQEAPLATRLIAFVCMNNIFFSSSSAAICWIAWERGLMLSMTTRNERILQHGEAHLQFAALLYNDYLQIKPTPDAIGRIVGEAVELEKHFSQELLQEPILDLNATSMDMFIEHFANRILRICGLPPLYEYAINPVRLSTTCS